MSKQTKHILVIRMSAMGDVAMTVPVLRALTEQYPELKITVLTQTFFNPIFRGLKNVEVHCADLKEKHKGLFGIYQLAQELTQAYNFDAVADLHNVIRSKVLKTFLKIDDFVVIDKGRKEKKDLTKGVFFEQLKSTHERYADVFKALGYSEGKHLKSCCCMTNNK